MGADKAVHLTDPALAGSDAVQTSYALAQVLSTLEYDLVIAGSEATDSRMSIMTALLAERTGQPQLSGARKVTADGSGTVRIERQTESGYDVVEAATPRSSPSSRRSTSRATRRSRGSWRPRRSR
jgi:electron transfer flavoprotein beta subunit